MPTAFHSRFPRIAILAALAAGLLASTPAHAAGAFKIPAPAAGPNTRALETALDRYVATPDPTFAWHAVGKVSRDGATVVSIDMSSQTWLTTNEVNRTVWRHWLTIVRPDNLDSDTALLFIAGGNNRDNQPPKPGKELAQIALGTRSVVAELKMVPNQTLVFGGDGHERNEDDLIAYTWDKYMRTGDERWPARLPMTKAAVRALDTVEAWTGSADGGGKKVSKFVVAGGSKRGWTTWTTAIVDKRVVAICPIVIDVLNLPESMVHHFRAYGFFAPAVGNYSEQHIMDWLGTPEMTALCKIEDPFQYRARLTMPKLVMNAGGDQFFLPDSSQFYFDRLPGTKYLRYVPNADHSLRGSDAYETLAAWQWATSHRTVLPRFSWSNEADGSIRVETQDKPKSAKLWQIHNQDARDFRLEAIGPAWWATQLADEGKQVFRGKPTAATKGWTAFMIELTYDIGAPVPLKLTTAVRVTPDTLPFAAPNPTRPKGFLQR
ncbi:MAG: PhoPQ-activated pathogenicity [Verrucomicrobia bacterium]|nr:MAG: PhoPQ-activated pathogenicity [Verrucomicrobiota bacterium]